MNKRIVLLDQEEFNPASFYGLGLGSEIYTTQFLDSVDVSTRMATLELKETDAVMLVGAGGFKYLQQFYHFGIRSENYSDCAKLRRLSIEGGAYAKCVLEVPKKNDEVVLDFMSPDFTKQADFSWFKSKVIHTFNDSMVFLDWLESQPEDTDFGFDYEASGMPLDIQFEISGASICNFNFGGFISFTDIRHETTPENYKLLLQRLGKFLEKRMEHIWTYNMQYEFQVSHRMLGVDLYNLCDSSVVNVLDGYHLKKYSLKWTAQRLLQTDVWDSEFDRISELIDSMLFEEVGKLKKEKHKILKVTPETYKNTPEWNELCKRYPDYVSEFEALILEYWGNAFMCIPSEILGYYCNLDAFYTLLIYLSRKSVYSQKAFNTFLDNLRLACRLHSCGINKNEEFRSDYEKYCKEQMAWGITYCAEARCRIKMYQHQIKAADINKYHPVAIKLLKDNHFFNGDALEITKYLLSSNVDHLDAYKYGLDEGSVLMKFGVDFADEFVKLTEESMLEAGMLKPDKNIPGLLNVKSKIDDGVVRKKKLLGILSEKIKPILGIDKIKPGDTKLIELEKYLYYERAYNELMKVSKNQLNDINNIPSEIYIFGQKLDLPRYSDYISDNYFKCKSPIENDEICLEFAQLYPRESAWLGAMLESTQQLTNTTKYYSSLGINTVEEGFNHFLDACNGKIDPTCYPQKVYDLTAEFYKNLGCDQVKEVWSNFNGYAAQEQFFPNVTDQYEEYCKIFDESDLQNNFGFMRKMVLNYLMYKKYSKVMGTYIGWYDYKKENYVGMFKGGDKWVIENPKNHIMIREADPNEPGAVCKMSTKFQCMEKSSKRWSSGYHTIISHSDIKSTVSAYPGCLLTYFDISSAEVKSAGFASGDPDLIDKFINGIDIYIYTAKLYLGEEGWNNLSEGEKKKWRKNFKTIFLGILYGLGKNSLATRLNCTPEEAESIIQSVYHAFPKLREYVAGQQQYPLDHEGCINTFFGDRLQVDEWKYYQDATPREKKGLEARIQRLGVNLPIQGGTSTAMSSGFFNDLRVAVREGWNLTSFITVHDSNTCNLPAYKIWDIRKFYDTNFTDFCYEATGIKLLFDLEVGSNYNDSCSMTVISDDIVEFKGNALSLLQIMDRLDECPNLVYETDMPREGLEPNYITNPMLRFIDEKGCSFKKDKSKYKVQFKKVSLK